jgi:hypothetical protein
MPLQNYCCPVAKSWRGLVTAQANQYSSAQEAVIVARVLDQQQYVDLSLVVVLHLIAYCQQ